MSNDNIEIRVCANDLPKIRHRKTEKKFYGSKMVELNSDKSLETTITDASMESEVESDEETESDGEHMRRLIPSPIVRQCVSNDSKKSLTQMNQTKQIDDESVWSISIQMFVPFLLAGFGMVAASLLLDIVQVRGNRQFDGTRISRSETVLIFCYSIGRYTKKCPKCIYWYRRCSV